MRWNAVKRLVMGVFVAVMLLVGVSSTTAQGQVRVITTQPRVVVVRRPVFFPRFYYPYRYYTVYDPIAYQREQGYSDGRSRGKSDAKHGLANNPDSHKHYSDSDSVTYREAFLQGYADGYREQMNKVG